MDITGWVIAGVAALGLIAAGAGWLYKRGGQERELSIAVRENTTVTRDLVVTLTSFKEFTVGQLHDLKLTQQELSQRLAAVEKNRSQQP